MRIQKINVKNFRLLADVELALEDQTTLIVGRNNSGKTSLSEVMRRLLSEGTASFQLEDFSYASYDGFCAGLHAHNQGQEENEIRALIPAIELRLRFRYDPVQPDLGPLSPFVIDLDPACSEAVVVIRYELKDGEIAPFFDGHPSEPLTEETRNIFFRALRERIPKHYCLNILAEDPNDPDNRRLMQSSALRNLVKTGFINAQRGLDDVTLRESDVLAKILEGLFTTATSPMADAGDQQIAEELKAAVQEIQTQIDADFGIKLQDLMPALQSFGYPGLGGQQLHTETTLDIRKLLSNFTKIRYAGHSGITLPESYNGLGVRNLIFILLQLVGFYKAFKAESTAPFAHLVFIEEPEAHLHPQMQEVFIRQLTKVAQQLVSGETDATPWPVQFVVSTHSSHVANEAGFESIRYFLGTNIPSTEIPIRQTKIKDLREGLGVMPEPDKKFLHKYMTLTRCDLFFADKAVLVEGVSERLLLPVIIGKLEAAEPHIPKLSSQYLSVIEVGGAHAHRFFDLLGFLELRCLIITDLDSVTQPGGTACAVHQGSSTSNACIKAWFSSDEPCTLSNLSAKVDADKVRGECRIAYQCAEISGGPCGRTFEDAFFLANVPLFGLTGTTGDALELEARSKATELKKSDFALKHAIDVTDWITPKYILDGVRWLAANEEPVTNQTPVGAIEGAATQAGGDADA